MPADAGIRFGQYILVRRIARGGMAEVFLAQQRGLEGFDRRVAVKRILPHLADSSDFMKMFFGEAKLAAQLSHPNIVHIYEFGKVNEDYFIAMEFVDGVHAGHLFKYGEQKERLPPTLVARIGADAANALHYAHELRAPTGKLLGLVHRDVSPANIMVSYDGVVKLCDFGIAKAAAATDHLTNPGQVKGKYAYMSPEQTIAGQLDGRSDVFSLAIVMWELLAARFIVSRGDAVASMRAIRDGKLDPIEKVAPNTPPPLAAALNWALQPQREKRATAAELAQALEAFLKSAPELATSMQLGGWIRARFAREGTGELPALVAPATGAAHGTQMSPGTLVVPGTVGGKTPYPSRRVVRKKLTETSDGTEIYTTSDLDDEAAETIKGPRRPPAPFGPGRPPQTEVVPPPHATEFTPPPPPPPMPTRVAMASAHAVSASSGPEAPERISSSIIPALPGPPSSPEIARPPTQRPITEGRRRHTPLPQEIARRRRRKTVLTIASLGGLALLSFVIALAASSGRAQPRASARRDAGVVSVIAREDALPIAPPPLDAALEPTIPEDAADGEQAHLIVRTIPDGGTVRVGEQTKVTSIRAGDTGKVPTADVLLDPGTHEVVAELDGWEKETRQVQLRAGETQRIEITFRKKLGTRVEGRAKTGRLTVRTTPWSNVYLGDRMLGQTPFADVELPAGTHTLVFRNPSRPTVKKKVTIKAGKASKLNFSL